MTLLDHRHIFPRSLLHVNFTVVLLHLPMDSSFCFVDDICMIKPSTAYFALLDSYGISDPLQTPRASYSPLKTQLLPGDRFR